MMQANMIYAQQSVARMIAGKMTKSKGVEYLVEKVTTGFRVFPKTPVYIGVDLAKKQAPTMPLPKPANKVSLGPNVLIELQFRGESPVYVDAWTNEGKAISFGKTALVSWSVAITEKGSIVQIVMPVAYAKKRGLIG